MYCPACDYSKNPLGAEECRNCGLPLARLDAPAPNGPVETSLMRDPVSVLDPRPPITVSADARLGSAMRQMIDGRTGAVLVTGAAGELVGILTERDFLTKVAGASGFEERPVREFMTHAPETVAPTDTLAFALGKMDAGGYRHLPVAEAGRPVGMISVRDVLRHVTEVCPDN